MKDLIQYFKEDVFDTTVKSVGDRDYLLDYFQKICSTELDLSIDNNSLIVNFNQHIMLYESPLHKLLDLCDLCGIEKIVFSDKHEVVIDNTYTNSIDFHKILIEVRNFKIYISPKARKINTIENLCIKCSETFTVNVNFEYESLKKYANFVFKNSDLDCKNMTISSVLSDIDISMLPNLENTENKIDTMHIKSPIDITCPNYGAVSINNLEVEELINFNNKWNFKEIQIILYINSKDNNTKQNIYTRVKKLITSFGKQGNHLKLLKFSTIKS